MVELAELPLVLCSEQIMQVSISGYHKITSKESDTILSQYRRRPPQLANLSLYEFFHSTKNNSWSNKQTVIPHFVGGRSIPVYPVTSSYARATLLIHKPWNEADKTVNDTQWVKKFYQFIINDKCPDSVRIAFQRVKNRHDQNKTFKEPTAGGESYSDVGCVELDKDTRDLMEHFTTFNGNLSSQVFMQGLTVNRGIEYDWGKRIHQVSRKNEKFRNTV